MHHIPAPSPAQPPFRPGLLMAPLGWLVQRLAADLKADRDLLTAICALDAYRMHGLALGLAFSEPDGWSPAIVKALAHGPLQSVLKQILGYWPQGLDRVLRALPDTAVLTPENYRALLAILDDKASSAHLHHCAAITEPLIVALAALPGPLRRPAIFALFDDIDGMDRFVAGLHFLCERTGLAFDHFVEKLGALNQPEQVRARIRRLAEALPLPDRLPDQSLGAFDRIDDPIHIRSLARLWQNCLGEHLHEVNEGSTLIYHARDDSSPAAAIVVRVNRLGWAVVDIKGPKNRHIAPEALSRYHETFLHAGIPPLVDLAAIRSLLWHRHFSHR